MIIPRGLTRFHKIIGSTLRHESGILIGQVSRLVTIEKEVEKPAHVVFISLIDFGILKTMVNSFPLRRVSSAQVRCVLEGKLKVPGKNVPLISRGVVIVVHVFEITHVRIVNREVHRIESEVVFEIQIVLPHRLRGSAVVCSLKGEEIALVGNLSRPLIAQAGTTSAMHIINITGGQIAFVKELGLGLFNGNIHSPKVTCILIGRRSLISPVDNAEVEELGIARCAPRNLVSSESQRLTEHRSFRRSVVTPPRIRARKDVDFIPGHFVFFAVVVTRLERMSIGEIDFPLVASHLTSRGITTNPVTHMVVDLAIINPSAEVTINTISRSAPLAGDDVGFLTDQMVDRDAVKSRRGIGDIRRHPRPF